MLSTSGVAATAAAAAAAAADWLAGWLFQFFERNLKFEFVS